MSKIKLECSWTEYHSGELIIEADNKIEAIELLKMRNNRLLEILIDKYSYDTFVSLSDIAIEEKEVGDIEKTDVSIKDDDMIEIED